MKSTGMKWIVPAVIVAITALIIFQVNWLMREAEMKKRDEQRRAGEAVRATCVSMEDQVAKGFIGNSLDSMIDRRPFVMNDSVRVMHSGDSIRQVVVINDSGLRQHVIAGTPPPPVPPIPPHGDSFDVPLPPPPPVWESSDSANVIVMRRAENMKNAFEDVMMEYVFSAGMPPRIDSAMLDSTLDAKLKENGIDYKYSREIRPGRREVVRPFDSLGEWEFHSKVFAGEQGPFGPELVVKIEPAGSSAFMRILPQIIFSLLITAGMLILLLLIYREAVKQKKIGDIRRDFINNMTHEFKTPLATMSLAADTIMNEKVIGDKDKVKYYAEQIKSENKKLNMQVEKVLELALTEKTGMAMNKQLTNITELVLRAIRSMEMQVHAKGGTITLENNPKEIVLNVDAFHLEKVFVNLIDNALKYGGTPPRITVAIEQFRSGTQITFTDNGSGVPQSEWELIFDPFYRVSTGDVHNVKGFGIGLSYAKSVILEHNGSIMVSKSNSSGTTFTVILMHQ